MMRRVATAVALGATLVAASADAASAKSCATRTRVVEGTVLRVAITARGSVGCRRAQVVVIDGGWAAKRGWKCMAGGTEGRCQRGTRTVTWIESPQRPRSCGEAGADYGDVEGGSLYRIEDVRGLTCRAARRVVRRCIPRRHLPGWAALPAPAPHEQLRNGARQITMRGTAGGGARCTITGSS